ncbi:MAG: class IV adenylate cyclase [Acidobacteriota bacterium]
MAIETEVKIKVGAGELESVQRRLMQLGARQIAARAREENWLFDFADGRLADSGCALRLRLYGGQALLTFKGRIQEDPLYKKREEIEVPLAEGAAIRQIFEALGLQVVFSYAKFREILEIDSGGQRLHVCLDETPIGTFAELEGPPQAIEELAAQFGWGRESFIKKNYVELYSEPRA